MANSKFEFTHTLMFDEQKYLDVQLGSMKFKRPIRLVVGCIVAFAMLFWSYTLIVGGCFFAFLGITWFAIRKMPVHLGESFKANRFLRQSTSYTADENGFTIVTKGYRARISWTKVKAWRQTDDWLRIQTSGFPNGFFPVSELKQARVYDQFIATLREHGVKRK